MRDKQKSLPLVLRPVVCLSVCLSVTLSVSVCPSICLSVCLSVAACANLSAGVEKRGLRQRRCQTGRQDCETCWAILLEQTFMGGFLHRPIGVECDQLNWSASRLGPLGGRR